MSELDEIKKRIEKGTVTIGTKTTLNNLRCGNLEKIFLTKNSPREIKDEIKNIAEDTDIVELDMLNNELGIFCKKPFEISIIGFLRGKSK